VHEVAAIRSAVAQVLGAVEAEPCRRIIRVEMAVGVADHADESVLRQWFEVCALGTAAEGAELTIEWVPAEYRCFDCAHDFAIRRPVDAVACPRCGGIALHTSHSDLCEVRSAVVEQLAISRPVES